MKWLEISIATSHEAMDFISEICRDVGAGGTSIEDPQLLNDYILSGQWDCTDIPLAEHTEIVTVKAYLIVNGELDGRLATIKNEIAELKKSGVNVDPALISTCELEDEDWSDTWKQYFHTEKIGEKVTIKPTWESYDPEEGEIVIELDPGAAFGTGSHATTAMCIKALEKLVKQGDTVFDVGTGSGILSIVAVKLGANSVQAVDYDDSVLKIVQENLEQNHVESKVSVGRSDLMQNIQGKADLVIANIVADIIIRLFDQLDEHLKPDGSLLASGIIEERFDDVIKAGAEKGFAPTEINREKGWVCAVFKRKEAMQ